MLHTIIQSALTENRTLHANNITALCFIEPELLPMEVSHYANKDFQPFLLL